MKTKIVDIQSLNESQIKDMYDLMNRYYDNVSMEVFRKDLSEKTKLILLLSLDQQIKGFSTIFEEKLGLGKRQFICLYSGDTVLEKEFWGNGSLAMAFGRYLVDVKLRNPLTNVYWFLTSKGYKTYLLMTNNFPNHYPRYDRKTPDGYSQIMDFFYLRKFKSRYHSESGIIKLAEPLQTHLKTHVSDISEQDLKNPKIRYFESRNPNWKEGEELACIAKVTLWIPTRYVLKRILKGLSK